MAKQYRARWNLVPVLGLSLVLGAYGTAVATTAPGATAAGTGAAGQPMVPQAGATAPATAAPATAASATATTAPATATTTPATTAPATVTTAPAVPAAPPITTGPAVTTTAPAATAAPMTPAPVTPAVTATDAATTAAVPPAAPLPEGQMQLVASEQLIGLNVRNPAGENLGDINDIVIDAQANQARYAVIGFGGFLGLGERLFAYPLEVLELAPARNEVILNVSRAQLDQAPGYDRAQIPDWNDYLAQVDRFWGTARGPGWTGATGAGTAPVGTAPRTVAPATGTLGAPGTGATTAPAAPATGTTAVPPATGATAVPPATGTTAVPRATGAAAAPAATTGATVTPPVAGTAGLPPAAPGARVTPAMTAPPATATGTAAARGAAVAPMPQEVRQLRAVRATDLTNRNVISAQQMERIGRINDIVLDFRTGDVHFAVVGFDAGWFRPDQLVTIPIDAFRRDERYPNDVVLDMTQQQVAQAPSFHPERWPQFDHADFRGMWDRFLATTRTGTADGVRPGTAPATGVGTAPAPATRPATGPATAPATTGAATTAPATTGAATIGPAVAPAAGTGPATTVPPATR
jgi:sporulation protein YlmC with PRC-barrel domain